MTLDRRYPGEPKFTGLAIVRSTRGKSVSTQVQHRRTSDGRMGKTSGCFDTTDQNDMVTYEIGEVDPIGWTGVGVT